MILIEHLRMGKQSFSSYIDDVIWKLKIIENYFYERDIQIRRWHKLLFRNQIFYNKSSWNNKMTKIKHCS